MHILVDVYLALDIQCIIKPNMIQTSAYLAFFSIFIFELKNTKNNTVSNQKNFIFHIYKTWVAIDFHTDNYDFLIPWGIVYHEKSMSVIKLPKKMPFRLK